MSVKTFDASRVKLDDSCEACIKSDVCSKRLGRIKVNEAIDKLLEEQGKDGFRVTCQCLSFAPKQTQTFRKS